MGDICPDTTLIKNWKIGYRFELFSEYAATFPV